MRQLWKREDEEEVGDLLMKFCVGSNRFEVLTRDHPVMDLID